MKCLPPRAGPLAQSAPGLASAVPVAGCWREAARMVLLNAHSVPLTDTAVMVEGGTGDEACFL